MGSFFGSRPIFRAGKLKPENPVPRSFFVPKPYGNACYAGYSLLEYNISRRTTPSPLPLLSPNHCSLDQLEATYRGDRVRKWRLVFQKMAAKVASNHSQGDTEVRKTPVVSYWFEMKALVSSDLLLSPDYSV